MRDEFDFNPNPPMRCIFPAHVMVLTKWMLSAPEELTTQEADLLAAATHFGCTPVWGFVDDDPAGNMWPEVVPRPVVPGFLALEVGEC